MNGRIGLRMKLKTKKLALLKVKNILLKKNTLTKVGLLSMEVQRVELLVQFALIWLLNFFFQFYSFLQFLIHCLKNLSQNLFDPKLRIILAMPRLPSIPRFRFVLQNNNFLRIFRSILKNSFRMINQQS